MLIGAATAGAVFTPLSLGLFGIVFFWQLPHTAAIGWIYRHEYALSQVKVAAVVDPSGRLAGWSALIGAAGLLLASLIPATLPTIGWPYIAIAVSLGLVHLVFAARFLTAPTDANARRLWRISLVHLPALLAAVAFLGGVLFLSGEPVKPLGPTLIYEPKQEETPFSDTIGKTWHVIEQRLGKGRDRLAYARLLDNGRQFAVSVIGASDADRHRVERLVASPGILDFHFLADTRNNRALAKRALKATSNSVVVDLSGKKIAWWAPVKAGQRWKVESYPGIDWRSVKQDGGEVTQVLVTADPYNLTGGYLSHTEAAADSRGKPCLKFTFGSAGAQRLVGLTSSHLPNDTTGVHCKLGIILDGELWSWASILTTISDQVELDGSFERRELSDLARILNAGALPVGLRLVRVVPPDTAPTSVESPTAAGR